jgi:hypothetical protein
MAEGVDFAGAIGRGQALGSAFNQERRMSQQFPLLMQQAQQSIDAFPLQQQARQQAVDIGQSNLDVAQMSRQVQTAKALDGLAAQIQQTPDINQRAKILSGSIPVLKGLGITEDQIANFNVADDQAITAFRQSLVPAMSLIPSDRGVGMASAKTQILEDGTVIQSLPDGSVDVVSSTGRRIPPGVERQSVIQRAQQYKIDRLNQEAGVAVGQAQGVANATQREGRVSAIKKELSDRNRGAARESIRLNQALKLAGSATQGVQGSVKVQMAKLLPDIDVTNEAVLDQALKQLAVDQLQFFKGPTTDFEFTVVQSTTGELGDSATANVARLKSLERATWFNKREFDQFSRHVKAGGDPDTFSFNFGESVTTRRGVHTLQDLQDTAVDNNITIDEVLQRLNK